MNVYVIASEGGMCKIGKANDPSKRMRELSTGHPFKLTVAHVFPMDSASRSFDLEKAAHAKLASKRMSGEWFQVSESEAAAAIRSVLALAANAETVGAEPRTLDRLQAYGFCSVSKDLLSVQGELVALMGKNSASEPEIDNIQSRLIRCATAIREVFEGEFVDDDDI